jgi:hypothetical protein
MWNSTVQQNKADAFLMGCDVLAKAHHLLTRSDTACNYKSAARKPMQQVLTKSSSSLKTA